MKEVDFSGLYGQKQVKERLKFYHKAFCATSETPFLAFIGGAGSGKSEFAKKLGKSLLKKNGEKRDFFAVNCSTIKNNASFFDGVYPKYIADKEVNILLDECHNLPADLQQSFLTIFNTEKGHTRDFVYDNMEYHFNFKKSSFFFATTEPQSLFHALKDRLTRIDFAPYENEDMMNIVNDWSDCDFEDEALANLAKTCRGSARSCTKRAGDVNQYTASERLVKFEMKHWMDFCKVTATLPYGLEQTELQLLKALMDGPKKLQALSSILGMTPSALRLDTETYLLKKGFMYIDGPRHITRKGVNAIKGF